MICAAWVLAGVFVGAMMGVIVTALCAAAGREDRRRELEAQKRKEKNDHGKSGF